ncbi:MAG: methylaspartate ammonia-lyase [Planctomycetaceae bacterium]|nr:methylaspartate ammonia-lyase [Planctomycetaceae bacterium]
MRIEKAIVIPARGGYYNEDLDAIRAGAQRDGYFYNEKPRAPGFTSIRQPSEAFSMVLLLDSGAIAVGDGMSVEYSAAGGRQGRFQIAEQLPFLQSVCDTLEGQAIGSFQQMTTALQSQVFDERLHSNAAFYGASQALLQAVSLESGRSPVEILAEHLGVDPAERMIPMNVQCGEARQSGVDKAILKGADVLPHGLINELDLLGRDGQRLREYITWIVERIQKYGRDDYHPELHIDVYGMIGVIFEHDVDRMADYITGLGQCAKPYRLCLEAPVLMQTRAAQIELFGRLRQGLSERESGVLIIVDEWANDLEDIRAFVAAGATDMINVKSPDLGSIDNAGRAILDCWAGEVRPILGGSCTDTDVSARTMAQLALAAQPAWVLARPGMGVDEGLQIVHNEMARALAVMAARRG